MEFDIPSEPPFFEYENCHGFSVAVFCPMPGIFLPEFGKIQERLFGGEGMEGKKTVAMALGILGLFMSLCTLAVTFFALGSGPVLLAQSAGAPLRAEAMMEALCRGDMDGVGSMLYGSPGMGAAPGGSDPAAELIWEAYLNSIRYDFPGNCYATSSGVALDVRVVCMDVADVTAVLGDHALDLLNQRVAAAEDMQDIYDESQNYREDFVRDLLRDAALLSLEQAEALERVITLHLKCEQDAWWVMPTAELQNLLSGTLRAAESAGE